MTAISEAAPSFPDASLVAFDAAGGAVVLEPDATAPVVGPGFTWLHLRRDAPDNDARLNAAALDGFVYAALVADDTRPRCTFHGDGAILILRGVNLNPGAEPEDMISVRLWIEQARIVSVGLRPLQAVSDMLQALGRTHAPETPDALVAQLAVRLADRAEPVVAALNERVDALEDADGTDILKGARAELADIRRMAIALRRYMVPQNRPDHLRRRRSWLAGTCGAQPSARDRRTGGKAGRGTGCHP